MLDEDEELDELEEVSPEEELLEFDEEDSPEDELLELDELDKVPEELVEVSPEDDELLELEEAAPLLEVEELVFVVPLLEEELELPPPLLVEEDPIDPLLELEAIAPEELDDTTTPLELDEELTPDDEDPITITPVELLLLEEALVEPELEELEELVSPLVVDPLLLELPVSGPPDELEEELGCSPLSGLLESPIPLLEEDDVAPLDDAFAAPLELKSPSLSKSIPTGSPPFVHAETNVISIA